MVWAIGPVGPLGPPGGYVWSIVLGIGPTGPIGGPGGNVWSIATRDMGLHCCQSAASTPQLPGKMRLRVRASRNRKAMTPSKVRVRRRPAYDRLVLSDVIYLALRPKPLVESATNLQSPAGADAGAHTCARSARRSSTGARRRAAEGGAPNCLDPFSVALTALWTLCGQNSEDPWRPSPKPLISW